MEGLWFNLAGTERGAGALPLVSPRTPAWSSPRAAPATPQTENPLSRWLPSVFSVWVRQNLGLVSTVTCQKAVSEGGCALQRG